MIEAGNKNLVITGDVNMYGKSRDQRTRLLRTAYAKTDYLVVEPFLDWQIGEMIVIAPTNMRTMDKDTCTIKTYNPKTGELTCEDNLSGFHFGAQESTVDEWGVDMRAEVALLSRNIEINASQDDISHTLREPWGCRILVSDFIESNSAMTERAGSLMMDNVSVYGCGQKFTWKSAIKFENARMGNSMISNSAIHHGKSPGVIIKQSMNVQLFDNVVTDFAEHGIWVQNAIKVVLDGNWVFHVIEIADQEPKMFEYFGWKGGFTLSEMNRGMIVRNNIVAGTWHHGYHFVPKRCNDNNPDFVFENNVAHSISGYGAIALNVRNDCTLVENFVAYKVTETSIMLGGGS